MDRTASCCCGQVSITVEGEPALHLVCHCNNCKQRTGSAFGVSAYFADAQVKSKQGETSVYRIDNDATQQQRHFCKTCGTTVYWKINRFPNIPHIDQMTGVAAGCFVVDPLPEPALSAAHDQKCRWVELSVDKTVGSF